MAKEGPENLSVLKDNLFKFMNDLEMFKYNMDMIHGGIRQHDIETLQDNQYFRLI